MKSPLTICLGIAILAIAGLLCELFCLKAELAYEQSKPQPLRTIREIQQELVNRGHDIQVDNIWGIETDAALEQEIIKQESSKHYAVMRRTK